MTEETIIRAFNARQGALRPVCVGWGEELRVFGQKRKKEEEKIPDPWTG